MSKPSCAAVVGSGKEPISSTTVVVGVAGEGQGAHASSSTTAHQVFDNRPKSNSEVAKVNAAQVFDILSDCRRKAVFSPEDSYTLGEDDTSSDEESSSSSDSELVPPTANTEATKPWVNLFKDNRKPSKGFGLQFSPPSAEEVMLDDSDLQPLEEAWGHSLIGYVAGRFPGKKALMECCQKWGVNFSYSTHESGWLVFRFQNEEDMNQVISAGPYFIFQRPLLLKVMPPFFDFGNEELSKIPVWVKLRNLSLELWNPQALGKILSKVGLPIRTDQLTASKGSISFARALVEVDTSMDLIEEVCFRLPNGKVFTQKVEFENRPTF